MFEIKYKQSDEKYLFNSPEAVCDFLERKGYDEKFTEIGIPISMEVEGWCELAVVGEEFNGDDFIVSCLEEE